jgi:tyrosine-protein kinase
MATGPGCIRPASSACHRGGERGGHRVTPSPPPGDTTLVHALRVLARQKWLVVAAATLACGLVTALSVLQSPRYAASALVVVNPNASSPGATAGSLNPDAEARFDATQAQLARTHAIAAAAVRMAHSALSATTLLADSTVTSDPSSNILTFRVSSGSPVTATRLANAYARQFIAARQAQDSASIASELRVVSDGVAATKQQIQAATSAGTPTAGLRLKLTSLLQTQGELSTQEILQTGGTSMASDAAAATQTQPRIVRNAMAGLALGLILGLILAALRETLDARLRTAREISGSLRLQLLGRLPSPQSKAGRRVASNLLSGDGGYLESCRKLRLAVDYANLAVTARSILVTSAVEGEGKTTTAAHLAIAFAQAGRRVTLVDLDLRRPDLHRLFAIDQSPGVSEALLGECALGEVMHDVSHFAAWNSALPYDAAADPAAPRPHLRVIAAGRPMRTDEGLLVGGLLASETLPEMIDLLKADSDLLIIDTPPLLPVSDAGEVAAVVDAMLIVVRASALRGTALEEVHSTLERCLAAKLGYVLTDSEAEEGYRSYNINGSYYLPVGHLDNGSLGTRPSHTSP